jgi:myo-inositol-1(or 4)-monophosphatase
LTKNDFIEIKRIVNDAGEKLKMWSTENFHVNSKKSRTDLVTDVDYQIQEYLIEEINKSFPNSSFLAEESGLTETPEKNEYWVIDPIDGTVNFSRGLPEHCISVAYVENKEPTIGIIYSPFMNLFYSATKNNGAYLNDKRLRPHWAKNFEDAMISLGNERGKTYKYFKALEEKVMRIRLFGTAALQIAYVASGYLDAFISIRSHPWDVAAGHLILEEAGGEIVDINGKNVDIFQSDALYCNPYIIQDLINNLKNIQKFQ